MTSVAASSTIDLERYRTELTGFCYRMLASPFDADDAVQETMLRAWRASDRFEGRASARTWLYRIASNVCTDLAGARARRAMPMDLGPARAPLAEHLATPEVPWVEPIPDSELRDGDEASSPEHAVFTQESIRLAFVTALQRLPARQRAVLLLRDVMGWSAAEVAELLETSEASVNSALQRARVTLEEQQIRRERISATSTASDPATRAQLDRFVAAFERYEMDELAELLRADVEQSMPPFDLWFAGREDVLSWWFGPGSGCAGSRLVPAGSANGQPVYGQYKPADDGAGFVPWALVMFDLDETGKAVEATFFLDHERLFPRFGLSLDADFDIHR
jgi:RNA polymerase sigma-70 factor (ECF subfamily)